MLVYHIQMSKKCSGCKKLHAELTKKCSNCKECDRRYHEAHKEEKKVYHATYYEAKKTTILARSAEYRKENKEEIRARDNAYRNTRKGKMRHIMSDAKKMNRVITMTDDEIMDMTDMPCEYCGVETEDKVNRNGIDRLDSSKGYILDNCVSCCGVCNMMKGQIDPLTFIERCAHISYINGGPGSLTEHWSQVNKCSYIKYKNAMIKRGIIFELATNDFEDLKAGNCVYCHRPTTDEHSNGIDRTTHDIGYILHNCVTCCFDCNFMKKSHSVDYFIDRCIQISKKIHSFPSVPRCLMTCNKM